MKHVLSVFAFGDVSNEKHLFQLVKKLKLAELVLCNRRFCWLSSRLMSIGFLYIEVITSGNQQLK